MRHSINILLPTYNPNPEHLREAMMSLLHQTDNEWKLFIHDDYHPESQTEVIVKPFLNDHRITIERSTTRLGIGKNWNTCLARALQEDGEEVAFLFQDDVWAEDYLKKGREILKSDASIGMVAIKHDYQREGNMEKSDVYTSIDRWKKERNINGKQQGKGLLKQWIASGLKPNIIGEPSFVILRKNIMKKVGYFREDLPQCLDSEMWMRIVEQSDCYFLEDKAYGFFRVHENGASAHNEASGAGRIDRLLCMESILERGEIERWYTKKYYSETLINLCDQYTKRKRMQKKGVKQKWKLIILLLKHPILILSTLIKLAIAKNQKNR